MYVDISVYNGTAVQCGPMPQVYLVCELYLIFNMKAKQTIKGKGKVQPGTGHEGPQVE
jgi:hypothetical protein